MTTEFLLSSHLSLEEASEHIDLIRDILQKRLGPPTIKVLKNITYEGEKVLRAKLNKGSRLIFKWEKNDNNKEILHLITINTKHKYEEVKRELNGVNPRKPTRVTIEEISPVAEKKQPLDLKPAAKSDWALLTNNKIIIPDEDQKQALQNLRTPAVFTGPPGAGKTTVLYNSLLLTLKKEMEAAELSSEDEVTAEKIFFFSHSQNLLNILETDSKTHLQIPAITFTSWEKLLLLKNPGKQLIADNAFAEWFVSQKCSLADKMPEVVHYEFSLIAALGFNKYKELGERQCYYAKATEKKNELNRLLKAWLTHLEKFQLLDLMVSTIPNDQAEKYDRVFCDEAQNMPPVALRYLIQHTPKEGFAASLDSEQCLTLSPYIENCLLTLLHMHYGKYFAEHLPRSYRCSAIVAQIGCHVMHRKHQLDGKHDRRSYKEIKSALTIDGVVSWIAKEVFNQLDEHCKDPETTVLVPDNASQKEIDQIKKVLNTDYILRYSQAIGLDLKNVILWKPFSQVNAFKNLNKHGDKAIPDGLALAQWKAFNAVYMAITRAQVGVYIYEEDSFYKNLGEFILGNLPKNKILSAKKLTGEELIQKLKQAIETHLNQNQIEIARNLMVRLGMSDKEITDKIKAVQVLNNPPVQFPPSVVAQPVKITEQTSHKTMIKQDQAPVVNQPPRKGLAVTKALPIKNTAPQPNSDAIEIKKRAAAYSYIPKLLLNKNPDSLAPLFEHKNLITLLFETPVIDEGHRIFYESLFLRLLNDSIWADHLLILTMKKLEELPDLRKQFTGEFLCKKSINGRYSVFMYLIESQLGLQILMNLVAKNPKIAKKVSLEVLYGTHQSRDGKFLLSPFHVLVETLLGINFFLQLLAQNPMLSKEIPGKLLCQIIDHNEAGKHYYKSPLLWLILHNCELSKLVISKLTFANPSWVKDLTPEILCNLFPLKAGHLANTSILYWLVKYGLSTLQQLNKANPNLLEGITAKAFYTNTRNFSVFLGFIMDDNNDLEMMRKILTKNPKLTQEITFNDLSFKALVKVQDLPPYYISPLYWLCYRDECLEVLEELLKKNNGLAKKITSGVLCELYGYGSSILFELSRTNNGLHILNNLFKANPNLLPFLSYEALTRPMNVTSKATVLFNLCIFSTGLKIFSDLVDQNQNFIKKMTREIFTYKYQTFIGVHCSIFSILESTIIGQEIIQKLESLLPPPSIRPAKIAAQIGIFNNNDAPEMTLSSSEEYTPFS